MPVYATNTGGVDFKPIPSGMHPAICVRVIDLGTQKVVWAGKEKLQRKVLVSWELHSEDEDGEPLTIEKDGQTLPMTISKRYTLSLADNANLTADVSGWIGRTLTDQERERFDVSKMLGRRCMLNVCHTEKDGKTYSNIASVAQVPKAVKDTMPAEPTHPLVEFSLEEPDWTIFNSLSEGLRHVIEQSSEYQEKYNGGYKPVAVTDEDPFADD